MADLSSDTEESNCSGIGSHDWELVVSDPTLHPSFDIVEDDSVGVAEEEPQAVRLVMDANEIFQMNYFAVLPTSTRELSHQTEEMPSRNPAEELRTADVSSTFSLPPEEMAKLTTGTEFVVSGREVIPVRQSEQSVEHKLDWIEPSSPYPSCTVSTEEDEDRSSRKTESPTILAGLKAEITLKSESEWRRVKCAQADTLSESCTSSLPLSPAAGETRNLNSLTSLFLNEWSILNIDDHPSEAWWKRQLSLLQAGGGQANTLWSIAVAAAVVGLLILGHRWHRLRIQNQKLRLELGEKEKRISQLMYQLVRMKECVSSAKRIPVIRAQPTLLEHF